MSNAAMFASGPTRIRHGIAAAVVAMTASLFGAGSALADAASTRWVESFWPTAKAAGVSREVYTNALSGFEPDQSVLDRASSQAEFVKPIWEYLDGAVSDSRLTNGTTKLREWDRVLDQIEARYGVERHILVAIWGMESAYGAILDNHDIIKGTIRSLATLAYAGGSRRNFGQTQLVAALKILQRGDISARAMTGSWAGAMGHTQFIPTTYEAYAVDFDGDGRRDIWNSPADALASAANYLRASGWETGKTWGYEVSLPRNFDFRRAEDGRDRTLGDWQAMGVTRASGGGFPRAGDEARLYMPAGARGPIFLLLKNFRVIKRYNNADSYALAIGHLADRLHGYAPFQTAWARDHRPLAREERAELQRLLARLGLYSGDIDAKIGNGTRAAIRSYQASAGQVADGYASTMLLQQLRTTR